MNAAGVSEVKRPVQLNDSTRRFPAAATIGLGYLLTSVFLIIAGFVLTKILNNGPVVRWDQRIVRNLASNRTTFQNNFSSPWSRLADAPSIVCVAIGACLLLAIGRHWREIAWIASMLAVELATFLTISYIVDRPRPDVGHLGSLPSTGSFPSGHVAATIVLYGTLSTIVSRLFRRRTVTVVAWVLTIVAAGFVGWARMYRGMHHPLDVLAGGVLGLALWQTGVEAFSESLASSRIRRANSHPPLRTPTNPHT